MSQPGSNLVGYARASGPTQKLDLQIEAILQKGVRRERIYTDEGSGGPRTSRPGFTEMLEKLRKGQTLVLWSLDRLGRSVAEIIDAVERIRGIGAKLLVISEKIDPLTEEGRFAVEIVAAMAEMERGLIRERTAAGLAEGRENGKKPGRKAAMTAEMDDKAVELLRDGCKPDWVASKLGIGRSTLYEAMRERLAHRLLPDAPSR